MQFIILVLLESLYRLRVASSLRVHIILFILQRRRG